MTPVVTINVLWGGRYRGSLCNVPVVIGGPRKGDLVEFGPEHVADWWVGP
jgi:hypothetical protein